MKGSEHFYRTAVLFWYQFLHDVHDTWWSHWHWGLKLGRRNSRVTSCLMGEQSFTINSQSCRNLYLLTFDAATQCFNWLDIYSMWYHIDWISHWMLNTGETACHAGWVQLLVLRKRWVEASTQGMYQIPHYFWTSDISVIYLFCIPQVSCLGKCRSSCLTS